MNFHESLSEKSREEWEKLYEKLTGRKWQRPTKVDDPILDNPSELARFMSERPNPARRE